jgi:hypothetical protein
MCSFTPIQLCTCSQLFFVQLCTNAQLYDPQPCMGVQFSLIQADILCMHVYPTHAPTCVAISSTITHYAHVSSPQPRTPQCTIDRKKSTHNVWETEVYPQTPMWVFSLFLCTYTPLPLKTPV